MFSISAIASAAESETSRTSAGISVSPAIFAARQRPHQDRLHHPLLFYRRGKLLQRGLVHLGARLIAATLQLLDTQRGLILGGNLAVGVLVEKRIQTPAESLQPHVGFPVMRS